MSNSSTKKYFYKKFYEMLLFFLLLTFVYSQFAPIDKSMEKSLKNYIQTFKQGKLLNDRKFQKSENPKISIIISMYNEEKNVISVIRSIQNQNLEDIEIICVNDNSKDNTLSILNKLKEEDPRITIITNKSNRGILYNRIHGSLESKGEYITFVDANDGICNPEILLKAYDIATQKYNEKVEIVHYQTCGSEIKQNGEMGNFLLYSTFNSNNFDKLIKQPEIGDNYLQKSKNITNSIFVFDKLYKRQLIKRVASFIGPHIWNQNLTFSDDLLFVYSLMKMTKSIVIIKDIGYWHLFETHTTNNDWDIEGYKLKNPEKSNKIIGDNIIVIERLLELTDDDKGSLEFREFVLKQLGEEKYMKPLARSLYYDKYLSLCEKFINWKYIDKQSKERTIQFVKYLLKFKVDSEKMFGYIIEEEDNDEDDDDDEDYMIKSNEL